MAAEAADPELEREALLSAGELYEQASDVDSALGVYERYVAEFAQPVDVAIETRSKVAEMYRARGDERALPRAPRRARRGRRRRRAPSARTARAISRRRPGSCSRSRVTRRSTPCSSCSRSSRTSRASASSWTQALQAFEGLIAYEVGDVTTAATFHMAEIYSSFSRSLLDSERPTGLSAAELAEYEDVLEEEAFPFEERAIEVHEANVDVMIAAGIYNRWIEQSFARLAALMPGRYAKEEQSIGLARRDRDVHVPLARAPPSRSTPRCRRREPEGRRARAPAAERADDQARGARRRGLHDHRRGAREPGAARPLLGGRSAISSKACTSAASRSSKP